MTRAALSPLFVGLLALAACRTAPIYEVANAPIEPPRSLEEVGRLIERAAILQGWQTQQVRPGLLLATKRVGRHVASVAIEYQTDSYSITLRQSIALKQSEGWIHVRYNEWVHALERAIDRRMVAGPMH